ncbi:MAG: ComEC/Rec2 family competence protein [Bacillota bacterium]|nr:ComEC/Rec2 family competence protein [Bacillota bacterium]
MKSKNRKIKVPASISFLVVIIALVCYLQPWNTFTDSEEAEKTGSIGDCCLMVRFIDVGQGMATLLEHQGEFALIDTGDTEGRDALMSTLAEAKVESLTYLVGSHAHSDHIANFPQVLESYSVENVILNVYDYDSKTWDNALTAIDAAGLKATPAMTGDSFTLGDVELQVLSPWQEVTEYSETNDTSIVLKVSHGSDDFLICGDATVYVENELIYRFGEELQCEVYNVAHHGSYLSNSPQFLQAVAPDIYVISAGEGNQYDHPNAETLDRIANQGGKVYRTDESGTIVIYSDSQGINVISPQ